MTDRCPVCDYAGGDHSRDCTNRTRPAYPAIGDTSTGRGELRGGDIQAVPVSHRKQVRRPSRHDQRTPLPGDPGWDAYWSTREEVVRLLEEAAQEHKNRKGGKS